MNVDSVNKLCRAAFLRGRAVSFKEMGLSIREISNRLNVPKSCVHEWLKDFERTGNFIPRRSSGRVCKTSERDDRRLTRMANAEPRASANALNQHWATRTSVWTVYRRLASKLIKKYRMVVKPLRSRRTCELRERWAINHSFWSEARWNRVVFTDESRFRLHVNDGRVMVWRKRGQRFDERFITKSALAGGGSVHVWGGIWRGGRTALRILRQTVNGETYCATLETLVHEPNLPINWVLQDDNARPHRCARVNEFKTANGIRSLAVWPSFSPDLNVIEHCWDYFGRKVQAAAPTSLHQLEIVLQREWIEMPQEYVDNLVGSMRRRIREVIVARGGSTRY